jgi:hypothetical protein
LDAAATGFTAVDEQTAKTGARPGEVLGLRRGAFDLERGVWNQSCTSDQKKQTDYLRLSAHVSVPVNYSGGDNW